MPGADGQLKYVGPANQIRSGGVGIVFIKSGGAY